jgi:hypothetical protein
MATLLNEPSAGGLTVADQTVRERLRKANRWRSDADFIENIRTERSECPIRKRGRSCLIGNDLEMLLSVAKSELANDLQCACNIFTVFEAHKHRRRLLLEPFLNDIVQKSDLLAIRLPTSHTLRDMARDLYFLQFDAKAFFDQFSLESTVRKYFGFTVSGFAYQSTTLPMGFRPSCDIAQTSAELLLSYITPNVKKACYIDNFYFSSNSLADLQEAVRTFLDRCEQAGVQLNEWSLQPSSSFDALGEHYEGGPAGSRSLTDSTMEKLETAKSLIASPKQLSCRQAAAVVGILFFASRVLEIQPAFAYHALRWYREEVTYSGATRGWSSPAPLLTPLAREELLTWIHACVRNVPVPLAPQTDAPADVLIFSDASAWGTGSVLMNCNGAKTFSAPWRGGDITRDTHSSATAEPLAVIRNIEQALKLGMIKTGDTVEIATDHMGIIWAWRRGWGRSMAYNDLLLFFKHLAESRNIRCTCTFVRGSDNPADRASRGLDLEATDTWEQEGWNGGLGFSATPGCAVFASFQSVRIG